ncbi:hypothetical protein Tco_0480838 [Tanacetum coccineum]
MELRASLSQLHSDAVSNILTPSLANPDGVASICDAVSSHLEDSEMKMMKETPYELLKDDQKKQLGKNNEAKMTLYNDLPRKDDEDVDEEEEAEAFNLMARNFRKFFRKDNRFGRYNRFGNGNNRFGKGRGNSFGNKGGENSRQKGVSYNYRVDGHFASEYTKPKENKAFVRKA